MKITEITKKCEIHGDTIHSIYFYNGSGSVTVCLLCQKEKTKKRRQIPEKRKMDLEYSKKWISKNSEYVKNQAKERLMEERKNKKERIYTFVRENKESIYKLLFCFDSDLLLKNIRSYCLRHNLSNIEEVKDYILSRKKSKLYNKAVWGQSSLLKYHFGVRENWELVPENEKEKIRNEYKKKAISIVEEKIQEIELLYEGTK